MNIDNNMDGFNELYRNRNNIANMGNNRWTLLNRNIPFMYDSYQYTTKLMLMCTAVIGIFCIYNKLYNMDNMDDYSYDKGDESEYEKRILLFTGAYSFMALLNMVLVLLEVKEAREYYTIIELKYICKICKYKIILYNVIILCIVLNLADPFLLLKCVMLSGFVY